MTARALAVLGCDCAGDENAYRSRVADAGRPARCVRSGDAERLCSAPARSVHLFAAARRDRFARVTGRPAKPANLCIGGRP